VPSVASKYRPSCLEGSHKLGKSPTRDDINLMAAMKANYRRYLVNDPTANKEVPPPARGTSHLDAHPDTVTIAVGRKISNVYIDSDGDIENETVMVIHNSDGATVKTVSTKCSHHGDSRKNMQPLMQDPFRGIQVFNEVLLDEEDTCCSSEDNDDMDEAMDDGDHGVSNLSWSRTEAEPDVWYAEDVDDPDDPDPSIDAQTLREIEDLLGMEWDPKGVYVPPPDVKRNQNIKQASSKEIKGENKHMYHGKEMEAYHTR
jgi:hypothetical protein